MNTPKLDLSKLMNPPDVQSSEDSTALASRLGGFNEETANRKSKVKSISIQLEDLKQWEGNPRVSYTGDEQEALEESIKTNGVTEEIGVIHIKDTDEHIICDGYRRRHAIEKTGGNNQKVEVIIRKEFDTWGPDAELFLYKTALSSSSLKKKLSPYEQVKAIREYIRIYEERNPKEAPVSFSSVAIYKALGYTKTYAMQLGKFMTNFSQEEMEMLKDEDVSASFLKNVNSAMEELTKFPALRSAVIKSISSGDLSGKVGKEAIDQMVEVLEATGNDEGVVDQIEANLRAGVIENATDVTRSAEIHQQVKDSLPDVMKDNSPESKEKIKELSKKRLETEKKEEQKIETLAAQDPQAAYLRNVRKAANDLIKGLAGLELKKQTEKNREDIVNVLLRSDQAIREFLLIQSPDSLPKGSEDEANKEWNSGSEEGQLETTTA